MPFYDYFSDITGEEKEVFHSITEEPEILDSQGNKMKRKVSGGTGYIMKGGTRNKEWGKRYGGKKHKSDHTMTPEESANIKAQIDFDSRKDAEESKKDPYYKWRDTSDF